jgi:UDP-N-acetyl-D-mannosaminuronic acid transferase (WecB/TagA/CpsF family)
MSLLSKIKLCENKEDFLLKLNTFLKNNNKGFCCAINANIIVECFKKHQYLEIIKKAVFNTCDGINVKRIYNLTQKSKINLYPGPDLFNDLVFKDHPYKHYFLGGKESILNGLKENILSKNIDVDEKSFYSPPFLSADSFDYVAIAALINKQNSRYNLDRLRGPKTGNFYASFVAAY